MRIDRIVLTALVNVAMTGWALAYPMDCNTNAVYDVVPAHPRPNDVIAVYARATPTYCAGFECGSGGPPAFFGGSATRQGTQINLELFAAAEEVSQPGVGPAGPMHYDWVTLLGPLPEGSYSIVTHLNVIVGGVASGAGCPKQQTSFTVLQSNVANAVTVVEFYNSLLDHYFVTADPSEIADLDAGVHAGWKRTGGSFKGYPPGGEDGLPVCRFYSPPSSGIDSHFYTQDADECLALQLYRFLPPFSLVFNPWRLESVNVFRVERPRVIIGDCRPGTLPVYRLWNGRRDSNHRLTTEVGVRDAMIAKGYILEGWGSNAVFMCTPM